LLVKIIVPFLMGLIAFFIPALFTGNKEYGGVNTKDDERSRLIKHKAIAGSWIFMLILFIFSTTFDFFNLSNGPLGNFQFATDHPSLFYLIILVCSYFVYYIIYSKRLSSNEK